MTTQQLARLTASQVHDAKVTEAPYNRSVSGYGSKVPTQYMLQVGKRWHRVYSMVYGNSGSAYVLIGGGVRFLSPGVEFILETVRDGGTKDGARVAMRSWPAWMLESEGFHQAAVLSAHGFDTAGKE